MTYPRRLAETWTAYRIGDPEGRYPIYSAEGARRMAGRWNRVGDAVIYAARHYSTAMLEKLVHYNGVLPAGQHYIEITIPAGTSYTSFSVDHVPDWHRADAAAARAFGHRWFTAMESALLVVPSVVARIEENLLINPAHPDAAHIRHGLERPVWWDERLFGD